MRWLVWFGIQHAIEENARQLPSREVCNIAVILGFQLSFKGFQERREVAKGQAVNVQDASSREKRGVDSLSPKKYAVLHVTVETEEALIVEVCTSTFGVSIFFATSPYSPSTI